MLDNQVYQWASQSIRKTIDKVEIVDGGKNNKAYRIFSGTNCFFLKQYFADKKENNARFEREIDFYQLLNSHSVAGIAQLIEFNPNLGLALFQHLDGHVLQECNRHHVMQAANFIANINTQRIQASAKHIRSARGQLLSADDFIGDVEHRFAALNQVVIDGEVTDEFKVYLEQDVIPVINALKQKVADDGEKETFSSILSPSDFGFHNTIEGQQLSFFDFEYAGWDSPQKLITDFFAQPRFRVDSDLLSEFVDKAFPTAEPHKLVQQCCQLLPIAKLKWALIFVNDFRLSESQRRSFSGLNVNNKDYLKRQLNKSKSKLSEVNI